MKVLQRGNAGFGFSQAGGKIAAGQFVHTVQVFAFFFPAHLRCGPVRFRNRDIGTSGQRLYSFRKCAVLHFLHKRKNIPSGMTAVTVEKLPFFVYAERRGLLPVKRAARPIVAPLFLQRYITADHIDNIGAVFYLSFKIFIPNNAEI